MIRELTISSVMGYATELAEVLEMLASDDIDLEPMISHRYGSGEVIQAFETAKDASRAATVLVQYEPTQP
jgi:threonine dehydrogenase-like Zn-dependent dehydrogenase